MGQGDPRRKDQGGLDEVHRHRRNSGPRQDGVPDRGTSAREGFQGRRLRPARGSAEESGRAGCPQRGLGARSSASERSRHYLGRFRQRSRRGSLRQGGRARGREAGTHRRARFDGRAAILDAARGSSRREKSRSSRHSARARGSGRDGASSSSTARATPMPSSSADPSSPRLPRTSSIWGRRAPGRSRRWSTTLSFGLVLP